MSMLMDILQDFGVNSTLFMQIGNFLIFVILLNFILFRPIRRVISQRHDETASLEHSITDFQGRSDEQIKMIEEGRIAARKDGFAEKETLKGEGQAEEKAILQKIGSDAEAKRARARKEMEEAMDQVRKALEVEIEGFSGELVNKVLGRRAA